MNELVMVLYAVGSLGMAAYAISVWWLSQLQKEWERRHRENEEWLDLARKVEHETWRHHTLTRSGRQ